MTMYEKKMMVAKNKNKKEKKKRRKRRRKRRGRKLWEFLKSKGRIG